MAVQSAFAAGSPVQKTWRVVSRLLSDRSGAAQNARAQYLLLFFVGVHLLLCVAFHNERLYADTYHYLFNILTNGEPFIAHQRWSNVLSQWPTILAARMNADLDWAAFLFTATLPVMYAAGVLFVAFYFRMAIYAIWLYAAIAIVHAGHSFYHVVGEQPQAVFFAGLLYPLLASWMSNSRSPLRRGLGILLGSALVVLASLAHPSGIGLVFLVLLLDVMTHRVVRVEHVTLLVSWALMLLAKLLFLGSAYEKSKLFGRLSQYWEQLEHGHGSSSLTEGMVNVAVLASDYWWLLVLAALVVWHGRKRKRIPILVVSASVAYTLFAAMALKLPLLNTDFRPELSYYVDLELRAAFFILVLGFSLGGASSRLCKEVVQTLILIAIFAHNVIEITGNRQYYIDRREAILSIASAPDASGYKRLFIEADNTGRDISLPRASMVSESILVTALRPGVATKVLRFSTLPGESDLIRDKDISQALNNDYFSLGEGEFHRLSQTFANGDLWQFPFAEVHMWPAVDEELPRDHRIRVFLHVQNNSQQPLRSGRNPSGEVVVGYKWHKAETNRHGDDSSSPVDVYYAPLHLDVHSHYRQPLWLRTPVRPGSYRLVFLLATHTDAGEKGHIFTSRVEVPVPVVVR